MKELTTSQVARVYEIHLATVFRLILGAKVEARKDENGRWLIRKESIERWNRQRVRRAAKPAHEAGMSATA